MLIAQITDLHIGFAGDRPDEPNLLRLDRIVATLRDLRPQPDLLIASGDLTEHGDEASYRRLQSALAPLGFPVHCALGNHDRRDAFRAVFALTPVADGFVQYAIDDAPVRCIVLDTLDETIHGGSFCPMRARWLADRLAEHPDRPTLIVLHHPPVAVGIASMYPDPAEPWIARLAEALRGHTNVIGLLAGHLHRPIALTWQGRPLTVCPSTAPELALNLTPARSPCAGDRRLVVLAGEPRFALHQWTGERLITHFGAPPGPVVAEIRAER